MAICINGVKECTGCTYCQDEPEPVHTCTGCGETIYEGDEYFTVLGHTYCNNCVIEDIA